MTTDSRIKSPVDPSKVSRESQERDITENRELTDPDRLEIFRESFAQSVLPDLPKIPGWHTCWLTTNNPRDSIANRMRLGYVPIRPTDIPGWDVNEFSVKTPSYGDIIGINEMLAFKLPDRLYQMYMLEVHHNQPLAESRKLTDTADRIRREAQTGKSSIEEGDGMVAVREEVEAMQGKGTPTFT